MVSTSSAVIGTPTVLSLISLYYVRCKNVAVFRLKKLEHGVQDASLRDKLMNLRTYHMEFDPNNVRTSCT
jgi:hypothetical protein